jgi:transposase-like protein
MKIKATQKTNQGPLKESQLKVISQSILAATGIMKNDDLSAVMRQISGAVVEAAVKVEFDQHLGYKKHDQDSRNVSSNYRNGFNTKKITTDLGDIEIKTPRDRKGLFNSSLVPKGVSKLNGINDIIIALAAKNMSTRDTSEFLLNQLGINLSQEYISNVLDSIKERMYEFLGRQLPPAYFIV